MDGTVVIDAKIEENLLWIDTYKEVKLRLTMLDPSEKSQILKAVNQVINDHEIRIEELKKRRFQYESNHPNT